jgi:hypothetical protein
MNERKLGNSNLAVMLALVSAAPLVRLRRNSRSLITQY